jgi:hypothetical protein
LIPKQFLAKANLKQKFANLTIIMTKNILWREGWIKPLLTESLPSEKCGICNKEFGELDFVTSCEFCEIGIIHDICANNHIATSHTKELGEKINKHKEKQLHSFQ